MEQKLKQRICIEFCVKLQISATDTFEMLNKAFPNNAPKRTTVFEWHSRFEAGRISIEDDPRQGRPTYQKTDENVQKIADLIKENPRTTLLELEQDTGISKTTIGRIVTEDLRLKKTPAKFIPRFLTNEQKLCRLATCEDMLEMTRTDPEWKDKIITGDETWVYGYDPETKRQSAEWIGQDIAPNDFFLFPKLKAVLKGRHFDTREDIIEKSLLALKSIPKEAYKNCFDNWEKRWRCVDKERVTQAAILLLGAWLVVLPPAQTCRPSELPCGGGACVALARYCDGTDDCGDGSDEPSGCTGEFLVPTTQLHRRRFIIIYHLNDTSGLYLQPVTGHCGENSMSNTHSGSPSPNINWLVRSDSSLGLGRWWSSHSCPSRLGTWKPRSEKLSSLCDMARYASYYKCSNKRNNLIFAEERLLEAYYTRQQQSCPKGHLEILEEGQSTGGQFCGHMAGRSAVYYGGVGREVTLRVTVPISLPAVSFSLYLTFRFLALAHFATLFGPRSAPFSLGIPVAGTFCGRTFSDCSARRCKLRSPNFPGLYPRNVTCDLLVRPTGPARVIVRQDSEYKVALSPPRDTSECSPVGDIVKVYDGENPSAPLLAEWCGSGPLPAVTSSGPALLVRLISVQSHVLHSARLELDATIETASGPELRLDSRGKCELQVDARKDPRVGVLRSPRATLPPNTTCHVSLKGSSQHDRVWIVFLSYLIRGPRPTASVLDVCDVASLQLLHFGPPRRFCEQSGPIVCARAADYADLSPPRPCRPPTESYLSSGPEAGLAYRMADPGALAVWSVRYEIVDSYRQGEPQLDTLCDSRFFASSGTFSSPRNVFLYGRGGSQNLTCTYHFHAPPGHRVRMAITSARLRSDTCVHYLDNVVHQLRCRSTGTQRLALLLASEQWGVMSRPMACLCHLDSPLIAPLVLESTGSRASLSFLVTGMSSDQDATHFGFQGHYEFVSQEPCERGLSWLNASSEGELLFTPDVIMNMSLPLRCRWVLEAAPHKYLYLKIAGSDGSGGCSSGNRIAVYGPQDPEPRVLVCVLGNSREEFDVFSLAWYNESRTASRDQLIVEVMASVIPATFSVRWLEVTRRSGQSLRTVNCLHECPELSACISPELWCDGSAHCPSGYDEAHCGTTPALYVAGACLAVIVALLGAFALASSRASGSTRKRHPRRLRMEEFQLESPQ
ncbi:hypothetical protein LAZ67_1003416 [Cordylochernes scorpioides]|uniref:CUB domain-containing protein n=1 Tax=Cordylochernes scorpioides TaxID=51811 RepID=A0ABY6K0D6_9ARAC|nr:hypothetical protein LAZ67_1003416 [Cordylochernes scorpioides]